MKMKKILVFLLMVVLLASCGKLEYEATITYKVYYPENTVTKSYTIDSTSEPRYILGSDRGSNYLYVAPSFGVYARRTKLEDTSAPIEVISMTKTKK